MENQKLYNAFENLGKDVIEILKKKPANSISTKISRKIDIKTSSQVSTYDITEIDLSMLLIQCEREILSLPSAKNTINELKDDFIINKHLDHLVGSTSLGLTRITAEDCLRRFLVIFLTQLKKPCWDKDIFEKEYNNLENDFYKDTISYRAIAPLENFEGDFDKIKITDNLKIIKISKKELEEIWERGEFNSLVDRNKIWQIKYVIEIFCESEKIIDSDKHKSKEINVREEIEDILTTIRLYKFGTTGFNFIEIQSQESSILATGIQSIGGLVMQPYLGEKYYLQKSDIANFVKLFKSLKNIKGSTPNYLSIAIKRLKYAYDRILPEDKLLDYMIALEALFLKGDERQEMSYRLSMRVALLLGGNSSEKKEIFELMQNAYKKRSNIIHGERATEENANKDFVFRVEEYLRTSIKKILMERKYDKKTFYFYQRSRRFNF